MYVILSTSDRCFVDALLLATGKTRMRLVAPGQTDAFELELIDGHWIDANGQPMIVESIIPLGAGRARGSQGLGGPLTMAAVS